MKRFSIPYDNHSSETTLETSMKNFFLVGYYKFGEAAEGAALTIG